MSVKYSLMTVLQPSRFARAFEISGASTRVLPMEGLRGIAVGLVFLQHYCTQFLTYAKLDGPTAEIAAFFGSFGNYGVELFFVLSGYLIYSILLRRRPAFFGFMARRAQRLYPAFMVAFVIGMLADFARPEAKIPPHAIAGTEYIVANLLFLPGLLPIGALFAVNWSLSYEWWFYAGATVLFSVLGLGQLAAWARVSIIVLLAAMLLALSAADVPNVPVRGLCLFGGMLLAEAKMAGLPALPGPAAVAITLSAFALAEAQPLQPWLGSLLLAVGFCALSSAAFGNRSSVARPLSWQPLRWFGNISYSYYLVHGFVVVVALRELILLIGNTSSNLLFWGALSPVFALSCCAGATLFLLVERPFSLEQRSRTTALKGADAT
jgi:exopolysaccharide production protein ExoZ